MNIDSSSKIACNSSRFLQLPPARASFAQNLEMFIDQPTLDDVLHEVFSVLLDRGANVQGTRGQMKEITGVLMQIENPRSRLSTTETKGKIYSAIGELLWYLSGSNKLDPIAYYLKRYEDESDDGETIYGAYGPRIFLPIGTSQIDNVISLLRTNQNSKRAVVQIFSAKDIENPHKEIPCTCTLQFLIRDQRVDLIANMRSNDAFYGLPHDVFAFTMIQEIVARALGFEIGRYKHMVGSLHLYSDKFEEAAYYRREGFQPTDQPMPPMPPGDPFPQIRMLLAAEEKIREGKSSLNVLVGLHGYWADLGKMLLVYAAHKAKNVEEIARIEGLMSTAFYASFIQRTKNSLNESKA